MTFSEPFEDCCSNSNEHSQLEEEITALELQIKYMERHLLSLYRKAFQGQLSSLVLPKSVCSIIDDDEDVSTTSFCAQTSPLDHTHKVKKSAHRSLADHLGAFGMLNSPTMNADRLSQDIVRCISSIYCKIGSQVQRHRRGSVSPTSSLSLSSFSSRNPDCDTSWSPMSNCNTEDDPTMIHIRHIHLDDQTFNYAATMLQNFRSLVRNLEKIDPGKMKHEEKLAFWINIHNALVMHAYLAYGIGNRPKTSSVLRAAYNVGGHCINAYCIQSSILRIRSRNSAPWLQTLFPGKSVRHEYALEQVEPLVHFALSSGDYSDPMVRVYTAKGIFEELRIAKEEFVKGRVELEMNKDKETEVLVPRIIEYFAKDMSMGMEEVLEEIVEKRGLNMKRSSRGRRNTQKVIHWLPHRWRFGYTIHPDLVKSTTSLPPQ